MCAYMCNHTSGLTGKTSYTSPTGFTTYNIINYILYNMCLMYVGLGGISVF